MDGVASIYTTKLDFVISSNLKRHKHWEIHGSPNI